MTKPPVILSLFLMASIIALGNDGKDSAAGNPPDSYPAYIIQPGDVIDVRFFFNPELNEQNVQVRPDGRISMQMVGDVLLAGKTVEAASQDIEKLFAKQVKTASVSLQIRTFGAQNVYVWGEVPRPGLIPLASPLNLLSAIGSAGGISKLGNRNRVVLIRKQEDGTPAQMELSLFAAGKPTPQAMMPLQPFDVILVPETRIARVDRWVDQWIRQLIPAHLNAGFQYLYQRQGAGAAIPIVPF